MAREARVSPYAALRFERTRTIWEDGRRGVFRAFIRAWRFVPVTMCRYVGGYSGGYDT